MTCAGVNHIPQTVFTPPAVRRRLGATPTSALLPDKASLCVAMCAGHCCCHEVHLPCAFSPRGKGGEGHGDGPRRGPVLRSLDLAVLPRDDSGPPSELQARREKFARFEKDCSEVSKPWACSCVGSCGIQGHDGEAPCLAV